MRCFSDVLKKTSTLTFLTMFEKTKYRINDASNDVNRPPLLEHDLPQWRYRKRLVFKDDAMRTAWKISFGVVTNVWNQKRAGEIKPTHRGMRQKTTLDGDGVDWDHSTMMVLVHSDTDTYMAGFENITLASLHINQTKNRRRYANQCKRDTHIWLYGGQLVTFIFWSAVVVKGNFLRHLIRVTLEKPTLTIKVNNVNMKVRLLLGEWYGG